MSLTHIPLMPGPWLPLAESEMHAFLERLTSVLVRSHGPAVFTKNLPISGLRVMPLSLWQCLGRRRPVPAGGEPGRGDSSGSDVSRRHLAQAYQADHAEACQRLSDRPTSRMPRALSGRFHPC